MAKDFIKCWLLPKLKGEESYVSYIFMLQFTILPLKSEQGTWKFAQLKIPALFVLKCVSQEVMSNRLKLLWNYMGLAETTLTAVLQAIETR